ncbi:HDOD domain-containing protein [Janthinobacterium sp.]|uniref:HDOD domain-containing protein n=1 Tax=Janthinobacterium sp. TaxID=1871054 RepID=UPI00293D4FDD|nr:HDOD domain-containing protein [Janthinobacterium sp.]
MTVSESSLFPLVGLQAVANAHNEWVAVTLRVAPGEGKAIAALTSLLGDPAVFAALAPLDCIVPIDDPRALTASLLELLPAQRILFSIPAAICADKAVQQACLALSDEGYRFIADGAAGIGAARCGARALGFDAAAALPQAFQLMALPGPHLAFNVDSGARLRECRALGFGWYSGAYALQSSQEKSDDGTSRKRLLALLGLLARDADSRELETLLKQDPALSYHLLKLVNSAVFAISTPIHNFSQAINMLGRRQLQRWLQLLLYARPQDGAGANALLPLAALRAAQMETLCKMDGGDRDAQDIAFMVGVFSLLDVLLGMPMDDILGALQLDPAIALALRERAGPLGAMLALCERHAVVESDLSGVGIDPESYWSGLLQAYQWAIQVSRNL